MNGRRIDALAGSGDGRLALVVGAIGHRDLRTSELALLTQRVRDFFVSMQQRYPELRITLLTSLADGADRLVADVAESLSMPITFVLPMANDLYERDFDTRSLAEYRTLLGLGEVLTLPLARGNTAEDVTHPGAARDLQYAQLGAFIAAHCHILLALWDGQTNGLAGGTAQVIRFHQDDYMPGLSADEPRSRIDDADDESDLVYHVVCSRSRDGGDPLAPLRPGETWWLSRDDQFPRTQAMPARYEIVLRRMVEFSRDARMYRDRVARYGDSLVPPGVTVDAGAQGINDLYRVADTLARFYQRRESRALLALCSFAGVAGLCFVAYGDLPGQELMIYPYVAFLVAGMLAYGLERRGAWQRRHLDYRVLAEALRVQFFWAVAGVTRSALNRFGHDSFLKRQDLELGWIRNVLRVAGARDDALGSSAGESGIELAISNWIDDANTTRGQLGFYSARWHTRLRRHRVTSIVGALCFAAGLALAVWIALGQWWFDRKAADATIAFMGMLPLVAAIWQGYAHRTAEAELINQYQFMQRIFSNARRQLSRTDAPDERRRILRELGDAALREHSQWILRQRERPLSVTD